MATLFVSDIHLSGERPDISRAFCRFIRHKAVSAEALYILGDLFEAWLGDDLVPEEYHDALAALKALTEQGIPTFVMHGNRDFLLADGFTEATGCTLLAESSVIDLYGHPTLLLHGDTLCTDDVEYQKFRQVVRNPDWQQDFLAKTVAERLEMARRYREMSKTETAQKASDIMDVNPAVVKDTMQQANVLRLIHGHTHRPAVHEVSLENQTGQRIVLADWYSRGSYLECDAQGCRAHDLPVA